MKAVHSPELHTEREITVSLNNALLATLRPNTGPIPDDRMRKLRAYAEALVGPAIEHLDAGLLTPQELVFVFTANALRIQTLHVPGTGPVPAVAASKALFNGK